MKDNPIKNAMKSIRMKDETKEKIKNVCYEYESLALSPQAHRAGQVTLKVLAAVAVIALMTVSAFAASRLISFSMNKNGDEVEINASLPDENKDTDAPLRSWNSDEGEISVRLAFEFLPEDMTEDPTATHKYSGNGSNRSITFSGFDLRRSDLKTIVENIDTAEKFMAGGKEAYLLVSDSVSVYNKDLYVLFEEEEMVVHAIVGYGIGIDEIKAIAEGMSIVETDDVNIALPISNVPSPDSVSDIPFVITRPDDPVYRSDLLSMGETGSYENPFDSRTVRVDKVEILDSVSGFESGFINRDLIEKFVGENGELITYKRTEMIYSGDPAKGEKIKASFGETVETRKRFILVTVTTDCAGEEKDIRSFLHTFSLGGLVEAADGSIERTQGRQNFVIDSTPGAHADRHEPIYWKNIGGGQWVLGYLVDADECGGELYFYSRYAELHYVIK
ncbi:MAG: hypothetical protein E7671_03365 [Ruminococcaceae bacterium]|nr:hypothetical protein [Oscillospiraceae bacterium]